MSGMAMTQAPCSNASRADPRPEIHLAPNRLVRYAGVLAEAQRLGVLKIGLVSAEQFMP